MNTKESTKDLNKGQAANAVKKTIMDLIDGNGLFNFLLNYIKDLKNDSFYLVLSEHTASLLEQLKVNVNELHKQDENTLA